MPAYSADIDRAMALASSAHRDQRRKGSDVPYITHPAMVALLLSRAGLPDEVVIAGLLHDVVEDQDVTLDEVGEQFGDRVRSLVDAVTERKHDAGGERPWKVRKQESLDDLTTATADVAALKAADALHNCRTTVADLERDGTPVWSRFKSSPEEQVWYYGQVAKLVRQQLGAHVLAVELEQVVSELASWARR